jgi:hypothetical protein
MIPYQSLPSMNGPVCTHCSQHAQLLEIRPPCTSIKYVLCKKERLQHHPWRLGAWRRLVTVTLPSETASPLRPSPANPRRRSSPAETASPLRPSPTNPRRRSSSASPAASFQAIAAVAVAVGVGGCFWKLGSMVGVG